MHVLVTGGTGFLGRRIVAALKKDGHAVFALARSAEAEAEVERLGVGCVRGDLTTVLPPLPPVDAVVHAAAHVRFAGPREAFERINVAGTAAVLEAARRAGARTFLYVSAAAVVMDDRGSSLVGVDEEAPTFPRSFSAYIASKARAEASVLAANAPGFRTTALRPPGIWGPGDTFSSALPAMVAGGTFAFVDGGRYPYVTAHVDNVVEAVSLALERSPGGRAYFVNDAEPTTFRAFVSGIARALGLDVERAPSIPYALARLGANVMEAGAALSRARTDPPFTRTTVRLIGREFVTSDARARAELGYRGTTSREAGLAGYARDA